MSPLDDLIRSRIRAEGPLTVAGFMELALYHPEHGYYARAPRRTGRDGDFFTSVDVGPLFGATIAVQLAEMWDILRASGADAFHLVEAGAADGRLACDILDAARDSHPDLYAHLRVTLVERSRAARAAAHAILARHRERIAALDNRLPSGVTGVILANELLDALPVHAVTMTADGLRETYLAVKGDELMPVEGPLSSEAIGQEIARLGLTLAPGSRAEVGLAAARWTADAAAALHRGFLLLFDYGRPSGVLCPAYGAGSLTAHHRHTVDAVSWYERAGDCDLTADVNLTAVTAAACDSGLTPLGAVDQTYFLLALGVLARLDGDRTTVSVRQRLAARTLLAPGGLGSTMKVLAFGCDVGRPLLRGFAWGRLT